MKAVASPEADGEESGAIGHEVGGDGESGLEGCVGLVGELAFQKVGDFVDAGLERDEIEGQDAGYGDCGPGGGGREWDLEATADPSAALRDDKGGALGDDKGKWSWDGKGKGLWDDKGRAACGMAKGKGRGTTKGKGWGMTRGR